MSRHYNKKYKLTWHPHSKRWKKVYRGKSYYLTSKCKSKSDEEGYKAALREWETLKALIDAQSESATDFTPQKFLDDIVVKCTQEQLENSLHFATVYPKLNFLPPAITRREDKRLELVELVSEYLSQRRLSVKSKCLSTKQYAQDKAKLDDFIGFADTYGKTFVDEIDGTFLAFYRQAQISLTTMEGKEHAISSETCRKRLQTVLKFWKWAYVREYVPSKPRVLEDKYAHVMIERPNPKFWLKSEIRTLFKAASQRTKLYIGLACNCGYTQKEIATLTWEMFDNGGVIHRERPKSKQPQVHKLWPWLFRLLKKESHGRKGLCLLGANGNPLMTEGIKEDGNIKHCDAIRLAFNRTLKKTKLLSTGRTFKHIRKTSANFIDRIFENNRLTDMFLAHSTRSMREHYVKLHYTNYFNALEKLGAEYNLESLL